MKIKIFLLFILMIWVLSGCGYSEDWDDCSKLKRISVSTTAENSENICIVSYPHNYMSNGEWESMEKTAVPVLELSEEDGRYIWDYIVNLENPEYMKDYELFMDGYKGMYEGHTFTCAMAITYEDVWGEEYTILRLCFDEFPEGWTEFVDHFNDVCGATYLTDETKPQKMTPEYLMDITDIKEEDYYPMTLEQIINRLDLDMFDLIMAHSGKIAGYEIDNMLTKVYLPREVQNVESTANEFGHFVSDFIRDNFGKAAFDDLRVTYYDNVSYCWVRIDGQLVGFFRSCCINDKEHPGDVWLKKVTYNEEFEYYMWNEISGEYSYGADFYYNADGKYAILFDGPNNPAIIEAFVNAK